MTDQEWLSKIDETDDSEVKHHVVCHDCPFERLMSIKSMAEAGAELHESVYGHEVDVGELHVPTFDDNRKVVTDGGTRIEVIDAICAFVREDLNPGEWSVYYAKQIASETEYSPTEIGHYLGRAAGQNGRLEPIDISDRDIDVEPWADVEQTPRRWRIERTIATPASDPAIVTDGGLPESITGFSNTDRDELDCRGCGDLVERKHLFDRMCPGCRLRDDRDGASATVARIDRGDGIETDGGLDIDPAELSDEEIRAVLETPAFQKSLKYRRLAQGIEVLEEDDAIYRQLVATITEQHGSVSTRSSVEEVLDLFVEEVKTYTEGMEIDAADADQGDLSEVFVDEDDIDRGEGIETDGSEFGTEFVPSRIDQRLGSLLENWVNRQQPDDRCRFCNEQLDEEQPLENRFCDDDCESEWETVFEARLAIGKRDLEQRGYD